VARPLVTVYQEIQQPSGTPTTPDLNSIIVGPCYDIKYYPEDAGEILHGGEEISQRSPALRDFGIVFQSFHLIPTLTALENVAIPMEFRGLADSDKRARDALARVCLKHRLDHYPGQLSGGEQQRVAIARALMMNPKVLLTDEMTGNLDDQTSRIVFSLLMEIQSEYRLAIVSVTHDERLANAYNKIFRLENGSLISIK
jgi:predicted ABC-type transport system involved in lysophospholipase L1 biosynthesis ATPase subunit